jgi:hypothetical protein
VYAFRGAIDNEFQDEVSSHNSSQDSGNSDWTNVTLESEEDLGLGAYEDHQIGIPMAELLNEDMAVRAALGGMSHVFIRNRV